MTLYDKISTTGVDNLLLGKLIKWDKKKKTLNIFNK